jgi:integrase
MPPGTSLGAFGSSELGVPERPLLAPTIEDWPAKTVRLFIEPRRRLCLHLRRRPTTLSRRDHAAFRPSGAAAGLSRITFHDLRHSCATGALKVRISPKVISPYIGHANVGFFLQTYAHVLGNDDRDAAEQAAAFLIGDQWDFSKENRT